VNGCLCAIAIRNGWGHLADKFDEVSNDSKISMALTLKKADYLSTLYFWAGDQGHVDGFFELAAKTGDKDSLELSMADGQLEIDDNTADVMALAAGAGYYGMVQYLTTETFPTRWGYEEFQCDNCTDAAAENGHLCSHFTYPHGLVTMSRDHV
jgi:hypothetical protein